MKNYQLIVFDWDGTLMDSTEQITSCMRQALHACELPDMPDKELQQVIGLGLKEAVSALLPSLGDRRVNHVVEAYRDRWLSAPADLSRFFDGVENLLYGLYQQGVPMAVATGKSRRGLDKQFMETGTGHLFVTSRCADESLSKPAPDMLLEILQALDVAAENTLLIGDTEFDLQMAKSAGVDRIGVTYGVHEPDKLSIWEPIELIESPGELVRWFELNMLD